MNDVPTNADQGDMDQGMIRRWLERVRSVLRRGGQTKHQQHGRIQRPVGELGQRAQLRRLTRFRAGDHVRRSPSKMRAVSMDERWAQQNVIERLPYDQKVLARKVGVKASRR